jgi:hypothetical protein
VGVLLRCKIFLSFRGVSEKIRVGGEVVGWSQGEGVPWLVRWE